MRDIGVDTAGKIVFKHPVTKKTVVTDLMLEWFRR